MGGFYSSYEGVVVMGILVEWLMMLFNRFVCMEGDSDGCM